jgi:hypothetical protein
VYHPAPAVALVLLPEVSQSRRLELEKSSPLFASFTPLLSNSYQ